MRADLQDRLGEVLQQALFLIILVAVEWTLEMIDYLRSRGHICGTAKIGDGVALDLDHQ